MTRALLRKQAGHLTLHVEGHTRKETAADVCAAVSVLMDTLEAALEHLVHLEPSVQKEEGLFRLSVRESAESSLLVASAVLGLQMLSRQYPASVSVEAPDFA